MKTGKIDRLFFYPASGKAGPQSGRFQAVCGLCLRWLGRVYPFTKKRAVGRCLLLYHFLFDPFRQLPLIRDRLNCALPNIILDSPAQIMYN